MEGGGGETISLTKKKKGREESTKNQISILGRKDGGNHCLFKTKQRIKLLFKISGGTK